MSKLKALKLFLGQLIKYNPSYLLLHVLNRLVVVVRTILFLYIPKFLIDLVSGGKDYLETRNTLILIACITLGLYILETIFNTEITLGQTKNNNIFKELIVSKVMKMKYEHLEDPYYLDLRERAIMVFLNFNAVESLINALGSSFELISVMIGLGVIIFKLNPILLLILVALQFINLIAINLQNKTLREVMNNVVPINRKYGSLIGVTSDDRNAKDIRLYNMADIYGNEIYKYNNMIMEGFIGLGKTSSRSSSAMAIVNYLVSGITVLYSGLRVISTNFGSLISIGDFSLYTSSAVKFSDSFKIILTVFGEVITNLHFILPFEELMLLEDENLESKKVKLDKEVETIEFKNVSFKYPKTENYILKNISFKVNKGEKISVVGLNGAGKTTLIKLLCRLFTVTEGEILVNGINIEDYDFKSYIEKFSTIFQDFKMYKMTILENIMTNDLDLENINADENEIEKAKMDKMMRLLDEVEMSDKITKLENSYNSILGKAYDESGVELSGGQLQKLAIVRALYKESDVIIMDEPTSALDPIAEAKIYEDFNNLAKDKTVFYISHRMSSSVFCDKVLIINGGEVEDFDSHENLMKNESGLYYTLFKTQADNYKVS